MDTTERTKNLQERYVAMHDLLLNWIDADKRTLRLEAYCHGKRCTKEERDALERAKSKVRVAQNAYFNTAKDFVIFFNSLGE